MEANKGTQLSLLELSAGKRQIRMPKKRANELDGQTWTKYSISIWGDIRKTPEEVALGHPALFPVELPRRLLRCFTSEEDTIVLDPFAGLGLTVLAAEELGKTGIGLDIYPNFVRRASFPQHFCYNAEKDGINSKRSLTRLVYEAEEVNRGYLAQDNIWKLQKHERTFG